jgi:uncharacterized phiE125 gp8 family phage protein
MNIVVVTPPPFEPVSLAEVYSHLRLDPDSTGEPPELSHPDDAMLRRQITTAREKCEQITRRAFVQQTLRLERGPMRGNGRRGLQWYMNGCAEDWGQIELPRPPLIAISTVKYLDETNTLQTIDPVNYYEMSGLVAQLRFIAGFSTPALYLREDAIQIEYIAGYAPTADPPETQEDFAANVPASIKDAILIGVQLLYDELSPDKRVALENAQDALLRSFRIQTF